MTREEGDGHWQAYRSNCFFVDPIYPRMQLPPSPMTGSPFALIHASEGWRFCTKSRGVSVFTHKRKSEEGARRIACLTCATMPEIFMLPPSGSQ